MISASSTSPKSAYLPGLVAVGDAGLLPPPSAPSRFLGAYVLVGEIARQQTDIPGAGGV
jgi:hypothetical protein